MKLYNLKNVAKILLCGSILLGPTGCSDFLDEKDPSNLTPESFYTIPDHAEAAVAATYAGLRFYGDGAGIFSANWQMLEAVTGTATTETGQNSDLNNLYSLTYDGNTAHINNWYNGLYKIIANANLALEKIPTIPFLPPTATEAQKTKLLGEARFLRAWAYFNAVRLWGDIPLITTPQTANSTDFMPSRTPQEEVYKLIVEDLLAAEAAGLPVTDVSGRATQIAAKSLLAKVYLTMAGFPLSKGATHYKLAADKALEVINYSKANPSTLNLFSTYKEVHQESLKNRVEHIFMIQYNIAVASNPLGDYLPNFKPVTYAGPGGTGSTVPTRSFYASYDTGDLRTVDQEGWFYTTYFTNGNGAKFDLGAPYVFKHFNQTANGTQGVPGTQFNNLNVPLIRYAEVLLIFAEAQNELGAPTQEAYDAYKKVHDRSKLTTPGFATFTQSSFRDAVLRERWYEFAYEGITWFDMVRLRKVFNEKTKGFDAFIGHLNLNVGSGVALQAKHLLFPLGIQEMKNNPKLTPQNPGY
ncbi:RagB/SusD family nutrient uptake outer membrane protein [Dyadobacter frigoris]|uniref:RagB/SusD family nutrient uptake outer membrane protein n=1 Tax=Dyadobacter frigoris TaxID=2576211 RepID=A0A4U6CXX8_9BACT|nr:RagB/SusD family nutrient uptake outer membrane protein [Dyadobacter frigoris]TKT89730.1 RagB/SusD family nutrient uptake outer membrane protein [Dyadobacter frigoris]GLU54041.1 membrane protein [Dyadobacter frigoris]